jgi:hypothetical protein
MVYLTKIISKVMPKKFYEIDLWSLYYNTFHALNLSQSSKFVILVS